MITPSFFSRHIVPFFYFDDNELNFLHSSHHITQKITTFCDNWLLYIVFYFFLNNITKPGIINIIAINSEIININTPIISVMFGIIIKQIRIISVAGIKKLKLITKSFSVNPFIVKPLCKLSFFPLIVDTTQYHILLHHALTLS